jgi:hypothetical protein
MSYVFVLNAVVLQGAVRNAVFYNGVRGRLFSSPSSVFFFFYEERVRANYELFFFK